MPLKQEQASPERPRCMGGANEHWGFRNPVMRQMEKNKETEGKDKKEIQQKKDFSEDTTLVKQRVIPAKKGKRQS